MRTSLYSNPPASPMWLLIAAGMLQVLLITERILYRLLFLLVPLFYGHDDRAAVKQGRGKWAEAGGARQGGRAVAGSQGVHAAAQGAVRGRGDGVAAWLGVGMVSLPG